MHGGGGGDPFGGMGGMGDFWEQFAGGGTAGRNRSSGPNPFEDIFEEFEDFFNMGQGQGQRRQ